MFSAGGHEGNTQVFGGLFQVIVERCQRQTASSGPFQVSRGVGGEGVLAGFQKDPAEHV